MARFFVAIPSDRGGVDLHPMKAWLRKNPEELPHGFDPDNLTSHQLRNALRKRGWIVEQLEDEVRLFKPDRSTRQDVVTVIPGEARAKKDSIRAAIRERDWVRELVPLVQDSLQKEDSSLEVRDGYRLAYSREVLSYTGDKVERETGMHYETDLLVVERAGTQWTPRVVVEAKLGTVTTHDAITYSQKAATHKHVHPYLRYGVFLGARKHHPLPGRLFRHGAHFDFMISWKELEPTAHELATFIGLLAGEVAASRLLQEIIFNTRARDRASYTVLRRPVIAE